MLKSPAHETLPQLYPESVFATTTEHTHLSCSPKSADATNRVSENTKVSYVTNLTNSEPMVSPASKGFLHTRKWKLFGSGDDLGNFRKRFFGAAHTFALDDHSKDWSNTRVLVAQLMEHGFFEIFLAIIIVMNTVLIIMDTDRTAKDEEVPSWSKTTSRMCLGMFCVELGLRSYVYQRFFFDSPSNVFDFVVVLTDVSSEIASQFFHINVSFLRLFRLGRLLRFVAMLSFFRDLNEMITLMLKSLMSLVWAIVLLTALLLIWAILAVQFLHPLLQRLDEAGEFHDCPRCKKAFESVGTAMITFTAQLVFGDGWGMPTKVLLEQYPLSAAIIIPAGITTILGLMNIVLSVIVDKAHAQQEEHAARLIEAKEKQFLQAKTSLERMCATLDVDKSGEITLDELVQGFDSNPEFALIMNRLDITRNEVPNVFSMLDDDASGSVSYMEFVDQIHKMRVSDLRTLILFVKGGVTDMRKVLRQQLREVNNEVEQLRRNLFRDQPQKVQGPRRMSRPRTSRSIDTEPELEALMSVDPASTPIEQIGKIQQIGKEQVWLEIDTSISKNSGTVSCKRSALPPICALGEEPQYRPRIVSLGQDPHLFNGMHPPELTNETLASSTKTIS